jgi:hypothetical protein
MALYPNDGYAKITFRPSSTAQEEDTTRIKVRSYKSEIADLYADPRRLVVAFVPINDSGHPHGVELECFGSAAGLESLFNRAIQGIREVVATAGDSEEYLERTFEAPATKKEAVNA